MSPKHNLGILFHENLDAKHPDVHLTELLLMHRKCGLLLKENTTCVFILLVERLTNMFEHPCYMAAYEYIDQSQYAAKVIGCNWL